MCEDELITLQRLLEMGVIMAEELCSISSLMGKFESGGHNEKSSGASIEFEDWSEKSVFSGKSGG